VFNQEENKIELNKEYVNFEDFLTDNWNDLSELL
jgi:hypothetical protein